MKLTIALTVALLAPPIASANLAIFGSPPFDAETGDGYKVPPNEPVYLISTNLASDGTVLSPLIVYVSNVQQLKTYGTWRRNADYTIFPLNPNHNLHIAVGLNNARQASGLVRVVDDHDDEVWHLGRWEAAGALSVLSLPPESEANQLVNINNLGTITGVIRKQMPQNGPRDWAVRWNSAGQLAELSIPAGYGENAESQSWSINDNGQIVGAVASHVNPSDQRWFPVRWESDNSVTELTLTTNTNQVGIGGFAYHINSAGAVAGNIMLVEENLKVEYGAYWGSAGKAVLLERIPGVQRSDTHVHDMNDRGEILGSQSMWTELGSVMKIGKWSPDGSVIELQRYNSVPNTPDPYPMQINDSGYAVGRDGTGVLWKPDGEVIPLRSLLPADSEWTSLDFAIAISDTGWISGRGGFNPLGDAPGYARDWAMLLPEAGTYGLGDANFDESIDFNDLLIVAQNYGHATDGSVDVGDFNLDGVVDFNDLLVIAQNYGTDPTSFPVDGNNPALDFTSDWLLAQSMVPEQGVLSVIGVTMLILRRTRH